MYYQVLYVGPPDYGTNVDIDTLEATVEAILDRYDDKIAAISISNEFNLFKVFTWEKHCAATLPDQFKDYERAFDVDEVEPFQLAAEGQLYYDYAALIANRESTINEQHRKRVF